MYQNVPIIALIPARGGSKGVPNKNYRDLCGQPLIGHTFDQIDQAQYIDNTFVSTDSDLIRNYSLSRSMVVITRPDSISTDTSPTEAAVLHAIASHKTFFTDNSYILLLEPTSPFRRPSTIDRFIEYAVSNNIDSLFSVVEDFSNIGLIDSYSHFVPVRDSNARRRQDRTPLYIESSTIYIFSTRHILTTGQIPSSNWSCLTIDKSETFDINTELDFRIAQAYHSSLK